MTEKASAPETPNETALGESKIALGESKSKIALAGSKIALAGRKTALAGSKTALGERKIGLQVYRKTFVGCVRGLLRATTWMVRDKTRRRTCITLYSKAIWKKESVS